MIFKVNATIPFELLITDITGEERTDIASVALKVFHRETGSRVNDLDVSMSGTNGKWYYTWDSSITEGKYTVEYIVTDNDSNVFTQYEDLTVGYLEDELAEKPTLTDIENSTVLAKEATLTAMASDITLIKNIESGKWAISGNQMIFYAPDNVTELFRCNLFDSSGNPSMSEVFKRERV